VRFGGVRRQDAGRGGRQGHRAGQFGQPAHLGGDTARRPLKVCQHRVPGQPWAQLDGQDHVRGDRLLLQRGTEVPEGVDPEDVRRRGIPLATVGHLRATLRPQVASECISRQALTSLRKLAEYG